MEWTKTSDLLPQEYVIVETKIKGKEVALIAAEQEKEKATIVAEQKKIQAEGEAEAMRIKAEANAKVVASLTGELIEKQKVEKWNGSVPTVQGNATPIIDMRK
jgi:regulator of protease activity HflC (stomatin/prohibitin superfamily)